MTDLSQPQRSLLEHADFLRRLAVRLAGSEADDLQQDVWTASLTQPPRDTSSPRGWLAAVARNLWRNRLRDDGRRQRREQAAGTSDGVPAVDEIAAREEVRRRVVAAVLALPEDLRAVVLLRFYEGLDSPAIGARLRRAPSTVRTQLQTALAQLRRQLDEQHDGRRAAWAVPLLQWQHVLAAPLALPATAWLLRSMALAAAGGLVVVWALWPEGTPPVPVTTTTAAATADVAPASAAPPGATTARDPVALLQTCWTAPVDATLRDERPFGAIDVAVVDADTLSPLADVPVRLRTVAAAGSALAVADAPPTVTRQARSDASGTVHFTALPAGNYELAAELADGRSDWSRAFAARPAADVRLALHTDDFRGIAVVKVLDDHGHGVADARVELAVSDQHRGAIGFRGSPPFRGTTDARGVFRLQDPAHLDWIFEGLAVAHTDDGRVGSAVIARPEHRGNNPYVEVAVAAPGRVAGRLTGARSDWSGTSVELQQTVVYDCVLPDLAIGNHAAAVAADGTFTCAGLPAGRYHVHVDAGPAWCRALGGDIDSVQLLPVVVVRSGETTECPIAMQPARAVRGVVTAGGLPVPQARVRARRVMAAAERLFEHDTGTPGPESPYFEREWHAAADGTYLLPLPPGAWFVAVVARGLSFDVQRVDAGDSPVELHHELVPDGGLQGRAFDGLCLLRGDDSAHGVIHALDIGRGAFALRGLAPGRWQLGRFDRDFVPLRTIEVVAGTMQWLDLGAEGAGTVSGRLVVDGEPVPQVEVRLAGGNQRVRSGDDGRFALPVCAADLQTAPQLVAIDRGKPFACVPLPDGSGDRDLGDVALAAARLTIRTVDGDGHPEPATISLHQWGQVVDPLPWRSSGELVDQWILRTDGTVTARFDDGSELATTFAAGARELRIVHTPADTIDVLLRDADGAPRAGAEMIALPWGRSEPAPADGASFWAQAAARDRARAFATDVEGRAHLRGLPPGPVLVFFTGPWHRFAYARGMTTQGLPPAEGIAVVAVGQTTFVELALR